MDAFLQQREERLDKMIKQQEAMRSRAEERHNYLLENQEDILKTMLEQQDDVAKRHEELRKQAEERRNKMTAMRATMMNMSPEERMAYMDEHRSEFVDEQSPPPAPAGRPALPPWIQNPVRTPYPPAPQGR